MDFRNEYRIVPDEFAGYEVQIRRWWLPFWAQCWDYGPTNTHATEDDAARFADDHATGGSKKGRRGSVTFLGRLP